MAVLSHLASFLQVVFQMASRSQLLVQTFVSGPLLSVSELCLNTINSITAGFLKESPSWELVVVYGVKEWWAGRFSPYLPLSNQTILQLFSSPI